MIGAEETRFLATRLPRRWRQGIARWHATPTCSMIADCAHDQCLACGCGIGVIVHQHGRDHGKYCPAYPSCQCVADSSHGRQVGDERITRPQLLP